METAQTRSEDIGTGNAAEGQTLATIPSDILASIFLLLEVREVGRCACVCRAFCSISRDESKVWQPLCRAKWGNSTEVDQWIVPKEEASRVGQFPGVIGPCNYRYAPEEELICTYYLLRFGGVVQKRMLCVLLSRCEPLLGLWAGRREDFSPQGALFKFAWTQDSLECMRIVTGNLGLGIQKDVVLTLGPRSLVTGEVIDETHCILRSFQHLRLASSSNGAAVAAASVAVDGLSEVDSDGSPPRSFEAEMLRFMESNVLHRGRKARKSRRGSQSAYSGGAPPIPKLHHFVRVVPPDATKNTSLAGLWKGVYGGHGLEIISVNYDFSGRHARIVATKLTGDPNVPSGELTWRVSAKPVDVSPTVLDEAIRAFPWNNDENDVENCYEGEGHIAQHGFVHDEWVQGYLWEFKSGNIGFQWFDDNFLLAYHRLDADIVDC